MSSPVFVVDSRNVPLMPMSAAYARKLLHQGKAQWHPHHAFTVLQLTREVSKPALRPIVAGIIVHFRTVELLIIADGGRTTFPLLHIVVDLRTDIPIRLRRRAGHRRRRRAQGRYRAARRYGQPFKARRPSLARSVWANTLRTRHRARLAGRRYIPPTMRWRAQAIKRTIMTLSRLIPISHVMMLSPARSVEMPHTRRIETTLRQQLIDAYGQEQFDGTRIARCAYCGTTEGQIQAEHMIPVSRGGTDTWNNRVLACAACNARKGNRTPKEAHMSLLIPTTLTPVRANRSGIYIQWTTYLIAEQLVPHDIPVLWRQPRATQDMLGKHVLAALDTFITIPTLPLFVAKPIRRNAKQVFSAHNYPQGTSLQPGFTRVRRTVKRRIQVNRALMLLKVKNNWHVHVLAADAVLNPTGDRIVTRGMLCEGIRAGQLVQGIVAAIHSTGRLTLLVPTDVEREQVRWARVVISPRKYLHIRAAAQVIFLRPQDASR